MNLLQAVSATIDTTVATIMNLMNIAFFITFLDKMLTPSYIVFSVGFYQRLCNTVGFKFTRAVTSLVNYSVSVKRLNEFLLMEEIDSSLIKLPKDENTTLSIKNLEYKWSPDGFSLKHINIEAKKGDFIAIVGPVGAGKVDFKLGNYMV